VDEGLEAGPRRFVHHPVERLGQRGGGLHHLPLGVLGQQGQEAHRVGGRHGADATSVSTSPASATRSAAVSSPDRSARAAPAASRRVR
jgi:hypothetical protein